MLFSVMALKDIEYENPMQGDISIKKVQDSIMSAQTTV